MSVAFELDKFYSLEDLNNIPDDVRPNPMSEFNHFFQYACLQYIYIHGVSMEQYNVSSTYDIPGLAQEINTFYQCSFPRPTTIDSKIIWMLLVAAKYKHQEVTEAQRYVMQHVASMPGTIWSTCVFTHLRIPLLWMYSVTWQENPDAFTFLETILSSFVQKRGALPTCVEFLYLFQNQNQWRTILENDTRITLEAILVHVFPKGFQRLETILFRDLKSLPLQMQYLRLAPTVQELQWIRWKDAPVLDSCMICLDEFVSTDRVVRCDGSETGMQHEELPHTHRPERGCNHGVHLSCIIRPSYEMKQCAGCRRAFSTLRETQKKQVEFTRTQRKRWFEMGQAFPEPQKIEAPVAPSTTSNVPRLSNVNNVANAARSTSQANPPTRTVVRPRTTRSIQVRSTDAPPELRAFLAQRRIS